MNPEAFVADQVIVAWLRMSSPEEPGVMTRERLVTGPLQWTSNEVVAFTDGGVLLGVVTLGSTGQAALTTSTLAVGLHAVTAYYIGVAGFESSQSPEIFELVGWTWPAFQAMQAAYRTR